MLQLKSITKDYVTSSETVKALRGIDLSFRQKEFVSILGPSGCGKTTLLNIVGGLDHYTEGDLVISGKSTKTFTERDWDVYRNHRIGFIFQSYNLIPHQTILGNVELALTIAGISREERVRRAKEALDRVGLAGMYQKHPNQLSGGQCQRVAIARALVNDPEILLADEPTGALDTVTSVQIMDLIREISGERLVIMVTHNPELAEKYSTRIIRLLDGCVESDSNPFSPEEEERECAEIAEAEVTAMPDGKKKKPAKEKAKMSLWTAVRLSARNLLSKRGRTVMVGFAGSIGIIGIALVLAFSAGIKGYVASMQDDMLSGNPITIQSTTLDFNALSDLMNANQKAEIVKQPNRVYIDSTVEYIAKMSNSVNSMLIENDITEAYVNYVTAMPRDYYGAMILDYGMEMPIYFYTDFSLTKGGESHLLSIDLLTNNYKSILQQTDLKDYAPYVSSLSPSFKQAPNNNDYIRTQYDVLYGDIATEADEVMLVLDSDDKISDLLLARLGFFSQDEFLAIVNKAGGNEYDEALWRDSFTYEELTAKTFTLYANDNIFTLTDDGTKISVAYHGEGSDVNDAQSGLTLKISGILKPKENVSYGCLSSGIYYTEKLSDYLLDKNVSSEWMSVLKDAEKFEKFKKSFSLYQTQISYTYEYDYLGEVGTGKGAIGPSSASSMMASFGMGGASAGDDDMRQEYVRNFGGADFADDITIYPVSFDDKDKVTDYLDAWNGDGDVTVDGEVVTKDERGQIKYTDTLALIISIINTMIDVVSYALIAFTSVSLVVSTVMIGIITYVSVVERIKEIGVIRSLGGRRRDVSHLFNAEAFIIGALAGLFGIGATYLISAIVNAILYPLIHVRNIAALPASQAVVLVVLSIALTSVSGIIPAGSAARKDPVVALRTE